MLALPYQHIFPVYSVQICSSSFYRNPTHPSLSYPIERSVSYVVLYCAPPWTEKHVGLQTTTWDHPCLGPTTQRCVFNEVKACFYSGTTAAGVAFFFEELPLVGAEEIGGRSGVEW